MNNEYEQVTWDEARQTCLSNNADLVSIHSKEERKYFWNLAGRNTFWTGGNDINTEGSWTWSDGTPWKYTAWFYGQPDNANNNQDCLTLATFARGLFDDANCQKDKLPFICKGKSLIG